MRSQNSEALVSKKSHALRGELSWTRYRLLMRVENVMARNYYIEDAIAQNWSTRALERLINSSHHYFKQSMKALLCCLVKHKGS